MDPRRRAVARPVGDGHPPLRPALPLARYTLKRAKEVYETYYDIRYPGHERLAGRPLRVSSAYAWHASTAPPSARSRAGSASTGTSPTRRRATSRCARAAGRGCTGRRRSAPSTAPRARRRGCSTSPRSRSSRSPGRARPSSSSGCATTASRATSARSPTRRCSTAAAGSSATSRSRGSRRSVFAIVTGTAFGNHDASWIRRHCPHDGSVRLTDVTARWACFALWGPRARDILAPLTPDPLDFPYMTMREIAVGDVPVRALRVTFVGECGWELYCPTEYGAGLWRTLWEAGQPHGLRRRRLPGDRLAAAREGLPRLGRRHHPGRDPATRPGSGSACARTRRSSAPTRSRGEPRAAAALHRARGPALGRARQRAGADRRRRSAAA